MPLLSDRPPFVPFGTAHLASLASVAALAVSLVALVRARPGLGRPLRLTLAAAITTLVVFEFSVGAREGWLGWTALLPLELCDAALVLAVITLVVPRRATAEVVYFWAVSGTLLAMLTPELAWGFPRWEFVVFFGLHGLVLVAALVLVFGLGFRPRPGAPLRVWGITAAWAAAVGLVDLACGANYMYLRRKPLAATPLDWMGPWPVYIVVGAGIALGLFVLLGLPFRRDKTLGAS
ncbi:MAG TPA: TIGR02206 family membrane protein [Vicinamibacteria bacterium]|nr:TIGR02206 family membrane protein [Vicinamibacteria bacterium]